MLNRNILGKKIITLLCKYGPGRSILSIVPITKPVIISSLIITIFSRCDHVQAGPEEEGSVRPGHGEEVHHLHRRPEPAAEWRERDHPSGGAAETVGGPRVLVRQEGQDQGLLIYLFILHNAGYILVLSIMWCIARYRWLYTRYPGNLYCKK